MAGKYYDYSQKHFEYEVKGICIRTKCGFMTNYTKEWKEEGNETWETIYRMQTKNSAVDFIIFSSVDIRTGHTREVGGDAVRVVMRWKTKNGYIYRKVAKHYRLETLFKNLESTLKEASQNVFNLNYKEFTAELKKAV